MSDLSNNKCEACRSDASKLPLNQIEKYLTDYPHWNLRQENEIYMIFRVFSFPNFVAATEFVNKITRLSEEEGHHPKLIVEWGKVEVVWWTHKINGLHLNDFIMASKTDKIYGGG